MPSIGRLHPNVVVDLEVDPGFGERVNGDLQRWKLSDILVGVDAHLLGLHVGKIHAHLLGHSVPIAYVGARHLHKDPKVDKWLDRSKRGFHVQ